MGDSPKQIRAKPLLLGFHLNILLFLLQPPSFQNQAALIYDGNRQILFKHFQAWIVFGGNGHNPHNSLCAANG